jgi:hypothetical protein
VARGQRQEQEGCGEQRGDEFGECFFHGGSFPEWVDLESANKDF